MPVACPGQSCVNCGIHRWLIPRTTGEVSLLANAFRRALRLGETVRLALQYDGAYTIAFCRIVPAPGLLI